MTQSRNNSNYGNRNKKVGLHNYRQVVSVKNGVITYYNSIKEAVEKTGYSRIGIAQCLSGKRTKMFNTFWYYKDTFEQLYKQTN